MFAPSYFAPAYFARAYFPPQVEEEPPIPEAQPQITSGGAESVRYDHQPRRFDDDEVAMIVALLGANYL